MIDLRLGDCRNLLRGVTPGSVRLVVTSPPYAIGKEYERRMNCLSDYENWVWPIVLGCVRSLAPGGSLCWQTGNWIYAGERAEIVPLDTIMLPLFRRLGLKCRNRIVWSYPHGLHCSHRFSGRHETILWCTKGDEYHFDLDAVRIPQKWPGKRYFRGPRAGELSCNPLGKNPGDTWELDDFWAIGNVKHNHPEKTDHPCQFPEELVRRLVLSMTAPGDTVLDPFAGSGTVGKVATDYGRRAILFERRSDYAGIARDRIGMPLWLADAARLQRARSDVLWGLSRGARRFAESEICNSSPGSLTHAA